MITVRHNATIGKKLVDIISLREFMKNIPIEVMATKDPSLTWQIEPNHKYWNDNKNNSLGPDMLLKIEKWETAEVDYPDWEEHIRKVNKADLNFPIWICDMPDEFDITKRIEIIFDGMHRYTKAIRENHNTILVQKIRIEDIPDEYFINK